MQNDFPNTRTAIQNGIDRGLHTGMQLYVSVDGQSVIDDGMGLASVDRPLDADAIMWWRSAGKPLTAVAICLLVQRGELTLQTPIKVSLPETADSALGDVTIQRLLTHSSGIPLLETGWPFTAWSDVIKKICSGGTGESSAAYQPRSTWFLLGEILQRTDSKNRSFPEIMHAEILNPLGISEAWCGIPVEKLADVRHRLPDYYVRNKGQLRPSENDTDAWLSEASPGGNFRGPIRELGRFYEMLMRGGVTSSGTQLIHSDQVAAMTSRHRVDEFDETFQHVIDFGLGVIIDSNHHGAETVPYGYGRHCSPTTFGHGGAQCAMGFCDPVRKLVVAWATNGLCGEGLHQRRNRAINEAIYSDLGFL